MALVRPTGFQASTAGVAAQLRAWREQMDCDEYAALVDVLARLLERERARLAVYDLERRLGRAA